MAGRSYSNNRDKPFDIDKAGSGSKASKNKTPKIVRSDSRSGKRTTRTPQSTGHARKTGRTQTGRTQTGRAQTGRVQTGRAQTTRTQTARRGTTARTSSRNTSATSRPVTTRQNSTRTATSRRNSGTTRQNSTRTRQVPRTARALARGTQTAKNQRAGKKSARKQKKQARPTWRKVLSVVIKILIGLITVGIIIFAILYVTTPIPAVDEITEGGGTEVYFADSSVEPGTQSQAVTSADTSNLEKMGVVGSDNEYEYVDISTLPDYVKNAVVASEDSSFYTNWGVDVKGILRALVNNATTNTTQGGSTITQQYAELAYMGGVGKNSNYFDKLREAVLALKISQTQSKDEILNNYMNIIYFGRGAYGINAAAKAYFNCDAKDLSIKQAAMLAGIIPGPSIWDPAVDEKTAQERMSRTLDLMASYGYITNEQAEDKTLPETISTQDISNTASGTNGYLLQIVKDELLNTVGLSEEQIQSGNYKVVTTINSKCQQAMVDAVKQLPSDAPANLQVGGVSLDPQTGGIVAAYCGNNYKTHQLNNVTQAHAQAGSTFKPFALIEAAKDGISFDTKYNGNSPLLIDSASNLYVSNADDISYGDINLYQATAYSVNTVFAKLNQQVGASNTAANAKLAGIDSEIQENEVLNVLGSTSVTPLELCRAYNTLADNGVKTTPHIIDSVDIIKVKGTGSKQEKSDVYYKADTGATTVFDKSVVSQVTQALKTPTEYGLAKKASTLNRPVAGKSGTSSDYKSGWFVGYVPQLTTAFGIWQTGSDGEEENITPFGENKLGQAGSGFTLDAFINYSKTVLDGVPVKSLD